MKKDLLTKISGKNSFKNEYKLGFILKVVSDVEHGRISMEASRRKYNIGGKTTIKKWIDKYGQITKALPKENKLSKKPKKELSMEEEIALLRAENKELHCHKVVYEKLVDLAKRELNLDLKKNFEAAALESLKLKKPDIK